MAKLGKYIYGIMDSNGEKKFSLSGMTDFEEVYTIPYQDISAVVSDSEIVDFTHMLQDALARLLLKHQQVIERIMSMGQAIIPVRLGTFAINETEVRYILNRGYNLINNISKKISDKIEIDIVATWSDFNSVLKEIGEEKEIKELKENLLTNPQEITEDSRIKLGTMIHETLKRKREKYAFQIQNTLATLSHNFKVSELMDDKMIINDAFLINQHNQVDFVKSIEELDRNFAGKLNFRYIGPLPTYSFYTLEIMKLQFEDIDLARRKLKLSMNCASKDEIGKAYKRVVTSCHPDKNPDKPGIEREFDDINKSYRTLVDYCLASDQVSQGGNYSFIEDEFEKNSLLVRLKV